MNSREQFELWWSSEMNTEVMDLQRTNYPMTSDEDQQYFNYDTNRGWLVWNAARLDILRQRDELINALKQAISALDDCYEVCDYPANGTTKQDYALTTAKQAINSCK